MNQSLLARLTIPLRLLLLFAFAAAPCALSGAETGGPEAVPAAKNVGEKIPAFKLPGLDGKEWSLEDQKSPRAIVVLMVSTGCPMSNSYLGPIAELAKKRAVDGVAIVGINGNAGETREEIAAHAREYSIPFPVLLDPEQQAVRALAAEMNSEVFLLDSGRVLRYRGRIDDGYSARLKRNARVTTRDLETALDSVLAGKPVATPATRALGCPIVPRKEAGTSSPSAVTFARDVAPILQRRCQECHRPGEVGPFSLLTYRDAVRWGEDIVEYTKSRKMPPWKPAGPEESFFRDPRRMPEGEVETLARWHAAGMPEGNPADLPPPRKFPEGWQLGDPDLVLEVSAEMTIGASGKDLFRVFVLPTGIKEDRFVSAIEVRPGNKRVVHHTLNFVDTKGRARKLEEAWRGKGKDRDDHGPGYTVGMGVGFSPDGNLGGWAPGNLLRHLPDGVGYPLPAGSDVLIQVHYHRTGKVEVDRIRIGLHFAKVPVTRKLRSVVAGGLLTVIPAGEDRFPVRGAIELSEPANVLQVTPHMHLLGREIRASAVRPDGTSQDLIWIRDWDYNWQETYAFKEPLRLPAGTRIEVEAYYDNSAKNFLNPNQPPLPVTFGEETTNEMCFVFLGAVSDSGGRIKYRPVLGRLRREGAAESADKPEDKTEKKPAPRRASF
jgi:peroxiredoxin